MTGSWNRWGPEDEVGAPNLIGPEQVRHAAGLVRTGRVISLAQPISSTMMVPGHRPGVMHFMNRDGGDYAAGARQPGGFQFAEDTLVMPMHVGTHLDALCHCWTGGRLYNNYSGDLVRSRGAARLGIEKLPPIVTRGVLLDFFTDGGGLEDGTEITPDMITEALGRAGTTLQQGDAVLLRTGWFERQTGNADFNREPGLNVEAARLLAGADVALVGADNFAIEALPFREGTVFPVHQLLIRDFGIPLLEGLVLKPLAEAGATAFMFVTAPLPIEGGTGSPTVPMAIL
jgi:kynurenine formamidase